MAHRDLPGVIAPPPLIYLGVLFIGWGLTRIGTWPEAVDAGFGWLAAGFGLEPRLRQGAAVTLIIAGLLLDAVSAGLFRRRGTAVEPWKPSTVLVSDGPYRFSRNPIYLGFAVTYVGLAIGMDSWITLLLLVPCLVVVDRFVIQREERYLAAKFGADYLAYRQKVRRWL
ncbi:MAG: isoprenylcysteine carboxylmethyltransferase family protein [Brevundimonas sp.]|uniref:methyltransferase family protein n=1 Tax=Brevundimonas sp. TaxID=1871086 RepID=UPI0027344D5C|nr:isoprenylcysteine carboxylmethyltransferase family protein [Brevundimonas sp.]MDP3368967.1 isoprenylcysteine carboxylmethyltransferase family protein [Brevundimonas sp.]MDP3655427.1 isoprenylcysteine carboxylmethyltransferase family protein [Brevundimonas sp.]MDZ4108729.1 isoprenylcysteine carboxylmethyltransferase family protein [Brevundimonas sp.]MDZ4318753.1 isoprenylcysteine carboxylmethyltransferase family protein [Phenylobacterium sp.]